MKKLVAVFLFAVMVMTAGCGGDSEKDKQIESLEERVAELESEYEVYKKSEMDADNGLNTSNESGDTKGETPDIPDGSYRLGDTLEFNDFAITFTGCKIIKLDGETVFSDGTTEALVLFATFENNSGESCSPSTFTGYTIFQNGVEISDGTYGLEGIIDVADDLIKVQNGNSVDFYYAIAAPDDRASDITVEVSSYANFEDPSLSVVIPISTAE